MATEMQLFTVASLLRRGRALDQLSSTLSLVALLIGWESLLRFTAPVPINFSEAIIVASVGLGVNLVCAVLLHGNGHHADHSHSHSRRFSRA